MADLKKDSNGQWIALSGFVISLIIIILAVMANQAVIAGYHSSNAALEFPKENIRELNLQTRDNAAIARELAYEINKTSNESIHIIYDDLFNNCSSQMRMLYAIHGENINVELVSINSTTKVSNASEIDMIKVNITYANEKTFYVAEPEIIEVNV